MYFAANVSPKAILFDLQCCVLLVVENTWSSCVLRQQILIDTMPGCIIQTTFRVMRRQRVDGGCLTPKWYYQVLTLLSNRVVFGQALNQWTKGQPYGDAVQEFVRSTSHEGGGLWMSREYNKTSIQGSGVRGLPKRHFKNRLNIVPVGLSLMICCSGVSEAAIHKPLV